MVWLSKGPGSSAGDYRIDRGPCAGLRPRNSVLPVSISLAADGPLRTVDLKDNLNPIGRMYYAFSTMICTPASISQEVGLVLGAQAGEKRLGAVARDGDFRRFRRATETPFNLILSRAARRSPASTSSDPRSSPMARDREQRRVTWDAHKMLGVPLSCSAILLRRRGLLQKHLDESADYLFQSNTDDLNPGTRLLQCGRRNDGLKLWAAWQFHGDSGYDARLRQVVGLAHDAAQRIQDDPRLDLVRWPENCVSHESHPGNTVRADPVSLQVQEG